MMWTVIIESFFLAPGLVGWVLILLLLIPAFYMTVIGYVLQLVFSSLSDTLHIRPHPLALYWLFYLGVPATFSILGID